jgi:hypothetical protein
VDESMKETSLFVEEVRLTFVFKSVDPIPEDLLLEWLSENGYEKITEFPKRIGTSMFGIERINIARKGDCQILYDPRVGSLGIASNKPSNVVKEFNVIESMLKEKGYDLSQEIKFYEMLFQGRLFIKGKFKPLESICSFVGIEKFSRFKNVMGEEVAPFDIRFYPKREMKTTENLRGIPKWFDVHIYPFIENPGYYAVSIVFRDADSINVKSFTEDIANKVLGIFDIIVGGEG